jgi:phosphoribosylaminoimidazole-succinocarboxamide synthase
MATEITETSFSDLTLVSRGKVRDVYATSDPDVLLFVATDRISAYDVVLKECSFSHFLRYFPALAIHLLKPCGKTKSFVLPLSAFRVFQEKAVSSPHSLYSGSNTLKDVVPNHLITADVDAMPPELHKYKDVLQGRSMLVRKAKVIPIEAIVRGYITGKPRIAINAQYRL